MKRSVRLSAEERRQAIVQAVQGIFAEKGFDGTTTRELARAAGVSEALLYKHFPSKESLYSAMLEHCARGPGLLEYKRILALEPSTSTLILLVHFLIAYFARDCFAVAEKEALNRLAVRSLLEDGEFVRIAHKRFTHAWVSKFEACLHASAKTGELRKSPVRGDLRAWFVHHLGFALMLHLHPRVPAVGFKVSTDALIEQAVRFALIGAGIKEEAIERHYNPGALSLLTG